MSEFELLIVPTEEEGAEGQQHSEEDALQRGTEVVRVKLKKWSWLRPGFPKTMPPPLRDRVPAAQFAATVKCLNRILRALFSLRVAGWLALLGALGSLLTTVLAVWRIKGGWGFLNLGLIFFFVTLATICFLARRLHVKRMVKEYLELVNPRYNLLGLHLRLEKRFLRRWVLVITVQSQDPHQQLAAPLPGLFWPHVAGSGLSAPQHLQPQHVGFNPESIRTDQAPQPADSNHEAVASLDYL